MLSSKKSIVHQCNVMHRNALGRKKAGEKPFSPCSSTFHMLQPYIGDEKRVWITWSRINYGCFRVMLSLIHISTQFVVTDIKDVKQIISCESIQLSSLSQQVLLWYQAQKLTWIMMVLQAQEEASKLTGWVFLQFSSPELFLQCPAFLGYSVIFPSISALDRDFYRWMLEG